MWARRIVAILAFAMHVQQLAASNAVIWGSPYPTVLGRGGIKFQKSDTSTTCNAIAAGSIRYNAGTFEGCNGTAWAALAGGSSGVADITGANGVTASSSTGSVTLGLGTSLTAAFVGPLTGTASASSALVAGTAAVTVGGTGTTAAFTTCSVVYAGASGVYTEDNATFCYDQTNNRLGVGTNVLTAAVVVITPSTDFLALQINSGGIGNGASFDLNATAHGGKQWRMFSSGSGNGDIGGNRWGLRNMVDGSGVTTYKVILNPTGEIGFGGVTPTHGLHLNGSLRLQSITSGVLMADSTGAVTSGKGIAGTICGWSEASAFTAACNGADPTTGCVTGYTHRTAVASAVKFCTAN